MQAKVQIESRYCCMYCDKKAFLVRFSITQVAKPDVLGYILQSTVSFLLSQITKK